MTFDEACSIFEQRQVDRFDDSVDFLIDAAATKISDETLGKLCVAVAASGDPLILPKAQGPYVDVPSTGGPASLTTLLTPLLIAGQGTRVPKLSATGSIAGGIDTLELIPGFRSHLDKGAFLKALKDSGLAHVKPSDDFCPADNHLIKARRERDMMANPQLAVISLLAKKLAMPGTIAVFDFRVGRSGNIGASLEAAIEAKELFLRVANCVGLKIDVLLSDNRSFPSSALGRLESLSLLWRILNNRSIISLDNDHVDFCVELAARALNLVDSAVKDASELIIDALATGTSRRIFMEHISQQGGNVAFLEKIDNYRNDSDLISLKADRSGYWTPPDLFLAKEWIKREQRLIDSSDFPQSEKIRQQMGLSLQVTPGAHVSRGAVVVEIRFPTGKSPHLVPEWLGGYISDIAPPASRQIISQE